jgi:hypothetical protein
MSRWVFDVMETGSAAKVLTTESIEVATATINGDFEYYYLIAKRGGISQTVGTHAQLCTLAVLVGDN